MVYSLQMMMETDSDQRTQVTRGNPFQIEKYPSAFQQCLQHSAEVREAQRWQALWDIHDLVELEAAVASFHHLLANWIKPA